MMLLTTIIGMLLASNIVPWHALIIGTIGIGLVASSAAAINQLVDRHIDAQMARTRSRPLPAGNVSTEKASLFAAVIGVAGFIILLLWVNVLTAVLTLATLVGYAVIYTMYLKRATPQNIVIGGLAGAMPPLLGWTAVTNSISPLSLLLVLLIFAWTPPHFWALAIARYEEYAKVDIPMLPVTHGVSYTVFSITLYTVIMIAVSIFPIAVGLCGMVYFIGGSLLNGLFLYYVIRLNKTHCRKIAMRLFNYSIIYLMLMFLVLLVDHYLIT